MRNGCVTEKNCKAADARRELRKHTLSNGRLVFEDGASYIDCSILDTSASGARIRFSRNRSLPGQFYLINVRDRTAHAAVVAWQHDGYAGLRLTMTYPLSHTMPEQLGHLRKHWLDCAIG